MKTITTPDAPAAIGPYSQAIRANGLVFVSGQLPLDPKTGVLENDARKATAKSLDNIKAILAAEGLSLADAVKVTIYLADIMDFSAVNEIYAQYFSEPYPARVCIEVSALPKSACLEIDCIASAERG